MSYMDTASLELSDNKELFLVMLMLFWKILKVGSSLKGDSVYVCL